mmetsp:Transcript_2565/g.6256  ORF Transcript_2565/g.6256 Transcript_2565/m.6256 type:complete len:209 (-) Transcript_2565:126-752(-)
MLLVRAHRDHEATPRLQLIDERLWQSWCSCAHMNSVVGSVSRDPQASIASHQRQLAAVHKRLLAIFDDVLLRDLDEVGHVINANSMSLLANHLSHARCEVAGSAPDVQCPHARLKLVQEGFEAHGVHVGGADRDSKSDQLRGILVGVGANVVPSVNSFHRGLDPRRRDEPILLQVGDELSVGSAAAPPGAHRPLRAAAAGGNAKQRRV